MAILSVQQLKKYFGDTRAVDGIDLEIERRQLISLVGPNGAGKSTLINLISGLLTPDSGRILLEDRDITREPPGARIRLGIARSFQIVNLFERLSALDNVRIAIFSRDGRTHVATALADRDSRVRDEAMRVLEAFGLGGVWALAAQDLPQGQRKLLDVAVAYALRPRLILLDEPTSGVSTSDKGSIMDTISEVVRAGELTAIVVEHDMDVVYRYSDRIVAMHQGRILAQGTPEEIRNNPVVSATLLGVAAKEVS